MPAGLDWEFNHYFRLVRGRISIDIGNGIKLLSNRVFFQFSVANIIAGFNDYPSLEMDLQAAGILAEVNRIYSTNTAQMDYDVLLLSCPMMKGVI